MFYLPSTPNGRAVDEAWRAAGEGEPQQPERIGTLLISGEDACADPAVRALAEQADAVIAITMFADPVRGWVDLVLPGTSYLERDGTIVNLEGRPQRLRRAVIPPAPDEIAWIAKLAERFGVEIDPHARAVAAERARSASAAGGAGGRVPTGPPQSRRHTAKGGPLKLVRYRGLFSGPAVERVPELQFQRARARDRALGPRRRGAPHLGRRGGRRPLERDVGRRCARGSTGSWSTGPCGPPRSTSATSRRPSR